MIRRLLCRLLGHDWHTTHVNGYFIPTARVCCRCRLSHEWRGGIDGRWYEPGQWAIQGASHD